MDENRSLPSRRRTYQRLPARLREERVVLWVYAVSIFAGFLGLILVRFH